MKLKDLRSELKKPTPQPPPARRKCGVCGGNGRIMAWTMAGDMKCYGCEGSGYGSRKTDSRKPALHQHTHPTIIGATGYVTIDSDGGHYHETAFGPSSISKDTDEHHTHKLMNGSKTGPAKHYET